MACLGVLVVVLRKKTPPADKTVVGAIDEVESPTKPAAMTDGNDKVPDNDIVITKRRGHTDEHANVGVVTMTGKGREKKSNSKSFFSQPDKLNK